VLGQQLIQFVERLLVARLGQQPSGHRLDTRLSHHDVGVGCPRQFEQQAGRAGDDLGPRHPHLGAGARATPHLDEALGLQHPHGLAQRRPADAEVGHQLGLVRQEVAVLELTFDHHPAQRARDELSRLRGPDRRARADGVRADHRRQRCASRHYLSQSHLHRPAGLLCNSVNHVGRCPTR
jgi:hypothetical protein